jgi:hypothetical protein
VAIRSNSGLHFESPPEVTNPEVKAITLWLDRGIQALFLRMNNSDEVYLHVSTVAPPKPRVGLMVYADGVKWNPGSGEGMYVYKSTGWGFLG